MHRELREEFVNSLKEDLIGPYDEEEELQESPVSSYIMGKLAPSKEDIKIEDGFSHDFTEDEEDEDTYEDKEAERIHLSKNKQSSAGLKVFVGEQTKTLRATVTWADYLHNHDGTTKKHTFKRFGKKHELEISLKKSNVTGIHLEKNVYLSWLIHKLNTGTRMLSVYIENRRNNVQDHVEKHIFQVQLSLEGIQDEAFISEAYANGKLEADDYFYHKKPVFARGYGCAADWKQVSGNYAMKVNTTFLPRKEINGLDAELEKFRNFFSMLEFSREYNQEETFDKLNSLIEDYGIWIESLNDHEYMKDSEYKIIGERKIALCEENHRRMVEGFELIQKNEKAYEAFLFMNEAMHLSRSMAIYADDNDPENTLEDFKSDHSFWRPFQVGFILLNIKGIIEPDSEDRKILDLLYFPTGGGKTEAYLGVIAFMIAYRRITRQECTEYEKDGGVSVIVRYTLRLLTTQQRDRMLKLISACEMIRNEGEYDLGEKEISIGFWVGSGVTINKYYNLKTGGFIKANQADYNIYSLKSQIIKCPCCGGVLDKNNSYHLDLEKNRFKIYCANEKCYFSEKSIPVYLIDEDIYRHTPTVVIGTVDKFARITFEEKASQIFGKRDYECSECGSLLNSDEVGLDNCIKNGHYLEGKQKAVKNYYPPELILQDELHLITGPLGTIYGSYEMAVERLSTAVVNGKTIKPKYIASTATIDNADRQINALYAKNRYNQFPPDGHDSEDSYFAKEIEVEKQPFRLYLGVSSPYTSMKTTILRVYAVLLQTAQRYKEDDLYKDYIDAYWTLIGYYNSKRELGGAVRLIQDDIPDRIKVLKQKNNDEKLRFINNHDEITSRKKSSHIPQVLENLEKKVNEDPYPYDIAVATNMIQVGMDVDRLGLMAVTGQPKTTAEYIQATSRIGRQSPGLVVTIYNPYRSRDLSHYENFTAYHSHLYRYVEGTSATPFSARARERALHASLVGILRGEIEALRPNKNGPKGIENVDKETLEEIFSYIADRVTVVDPMNKERTMEDLQYFIDEWTKIQRDPKNLYYYVHHKNKGYQMKNLQRLLKIFGDYGQHHEKDTLNSMRNVQKETGLYLWEG